MLKNAFFLHAEIERIQKGETKKEPEKETYLDLFATKNLKLKERVLIPTKQYPRVSISFLLVPTLGPTVCCYQGAWSTWSISWLRKLCSVTLMWTQWDLNINILLMVFCFSFPVI